MAKDRSVTISLEPGEIAVLRFALDYISDYEALWQARAHLPNTTTPAEVLDIAASILRKLGPP